MKKPIYDLLNAIDAMPYIDQIGLILATLVSMYLLTLSFSWLFKIGNEHPWLEDEQRNWYD